MNYFYQVYDELTGDVWFYEADYGIHAMSDLLNIPVEELRQYGTEINGVYTVEPKEFETIFRRK